MVAASAILAVMGLAGIAPHDTLFMSGWTLSLSLVLFIFIGSIHYRSLHWTILSFSMFVFLVLMLSDCFIVGGILFPPLTRRTVSFVAIMFTLCGLLLFCTMDWKQEALTSRRRGGILLFALSILVCSAIVLTNAPLWVALIPLYAGFGILYYRFRVMLFWVIFRRRGVESIFEDSHDHLSYHSL